MNIIRSAAIIGLLATAATPTVASQGARRTPIQRPNTQPFPYHSGRVKRPSPLRSKQCFVEPAQEGGDDAPAILQAFQDCNCGGTVVLDANYTIGSPLDLTFLDAVDVALSGAITFSSDIDYWVANSYKYDFQNSSSYLKIGGKDVNIFGGGVGLIDGNGQPWWDAWAENDSLLRPITVVIDGLEGGSMTGIRMINPPNWFNLIANSSDILVSDMTLVARSANENEVKNSDGWDTYRSDSVVIQNSYVDNTDDCVSFKPNSTNVVVQGLVCNGSHGISVGSLGQYVDQYDIVENVYVYNNSMANASDAARIKVWPGVHSELEPILNGGGGAGYVKNVTYERYESTNNDWAIEVNQCYGQSNQTLCELYPSNMTISDIYFIDIWGTTSDANDPNVGTLVCSSPEQCYNFHAKNVSITSPSGGSQWICANFDTSDLEGFDCVAPDEG
ncbi:glycoside hydrolase family 28 protein [Xylariomycetidae sp. FL2044]|nr:glycoside hydrolase family 28 protein [Xylariomycetidae sp. FL2044]